MGSSIDHDEQTKLLHVQMWMARLQPFIVATGAVSMPVLTLLRNLKQLLLFANSENLMFYVCFFASCFSHV